MRTKAFPSFERKRALKIMKFWCTLVKQLRWATHRNLNTHLIRGSFKITHFLFLNTVLWFRQVAFTGNQGKKLPPTSHALSSLKTIYYFFFLCSSWFLVMNQKEVYLLFLQSKQITMACGDPTTMPSPAHHLSPFWTLLLCFSEDWESFCKFSGQGTPHRCLSSQTYCQCCVLDHKYVFTWSWYW